MAIKKPPKWAAEIDKFRYLRYNSDAPQGVERRSKAESSIFPANPIRREVVPMGNGRWAKALRFVVCFIIILWLMIYISPKAC